tara:strand:+ start:238 stop:399 length:162 start_codon:yes stop_codon:yes gene_type:complete
MDKGLVLKINLSKLNAEKIEYKYSFLDVLKTLSVVKREITQCKKIEIENLNLF